MQTVPPSHRGRGSSTSSASRSLRVRASLVGLLRLAATASRPSAEPPPADTSPGAADESRSSRAQQLVRREDDDEDEDYQDDVAVPFHVPSAPRRASPRELVRHEVDIAYDAGEGDGHAQKQEFLETTTSSNDGNDEDTMNHGASKVEALHSEQRPAPAASPPAVTSAEIESTPRSRPESPSSRTPAAKHRTTQLDEAVIEQEASSRSSTDATSGAESLTSNADSCAEDERHAIIPDARLCGTSDGGFCQKEGDGNGGFIMHDNGTAQWPENDAVAFETTYEDGGCRYQGTWMRNDVQGSETEKRSICRTLCGLATGCTHFAYTGWSYSSADLAQVFCRVFNGCDREYELDENESEFQQRLENYAAGWGSTMEERTPTVWRCLSPAAPGDSPSPSPTDSGDSPSAKTASATNGTNGTNTTDAEVAGGASVSAITAVAIAGAVILAVGAVLGYNEFNKNNPRDAAADAY